MNAQQLRIYAIADIHSPDSFRMAQSSPRRTTWSSRCGDIDDGTLDYIGYMSHGIPWLGVLWKPRSSAGNRFENLHARSDRISWSEARRLWRWTALQERYFRITTLSGRLRNFCRKMPPVDLFISHAPPPSAAMNGGLVSPTDYIHRGFDAFDAYLHAARPRFWLHGHLSPPLCLHGWENARSMGICGAQPLVLDFPAS